MAGVIVICVLDTYIYIYLEQYEMQFSLFIDVFFLIMSIRIGSWTSTWWRRCWRRKCWNHLLLPLTIRLATSRKTRYRFASLVLSVVLVWLIHTYALASSWHYHKDERWSDNIMQITIFFPLRTNTRGPLWRTTKPLSSLSKTRRLRKTWREPLTLRFNVASDPSSSTQSSTSGRRNRNSEQRGLEEGEEEMEE